MKNASGSRDLILYDGLCGFCNYWVRWIINRDRADQFRFAPQQSMVAAEALSRKGLNQSEAIAGNSIYLVLNYNRRGAASNEKLLADSDVTVNVLLLLGGPWRVLGFLLWLVPKTWRDGVYAVVARNRFRFAGRYEVCPLPGPEERAKFLA